MLLARRASCLTAQSNAAALAGAYQRARTPSKVLLLACALVQAFALGAP